MFIDSFDRVFNRIARDNRRIAVICKSGRVQTLRATELPKDTPSHLLGVYDSTIEPEYLMQDLDWADKHWIGE